MSKLYYHNENGEKSEPVTTAELMQLIQEGVVTADTMLETDCGYLGSAGESSSIFFEVSSPPDQASPKPKA